MHVDSEKNTLKGNMASLLVKNMMGVGDEITLSGHRNTAGQYIHDRYERLLGEISKGDSNLQTVLIKSAARKQMANGHYSDQNNESPCSLFSPDNRLQASSNQISIRYLHQVVS